jgi:hypothetical protein
MARPIVKFISPTHFKASTTVEENVDDDLIVNFIYKAQDVYIQQALGSTFYNRLKQGVVDEDLNTDEENFIRDYIQPCLVEWTLYELLPHISYKLTNKAISQKSSEFSTPTGLDEVKYLRQSVRDLAEFYLKRMNTFLCDYPQLFPTYQNPGEKVNLKKSNRSYFSGIYLAKNNTTKYDDYGDGK